VGRFDTLFNEEMFARFQEIKGKYKGERAWCVGNGPSLASTPLELLENEHTFGLTSIAKIYPSTSWRPSFYVSVAGAVMEGGSYVAAAKAAIEGTPSFLCAAFLPTLMEKSGETPLVPHDVYPLRVTCREKQTSPDVSVWSDDIFERVSKDGSSMLTVMQIAVYMGFSPLILIGCDMGWKAFDWEENKDPNHFIDSYWDYRKRGDRKIEMTERMARNCNHDVLVAHKIAKQACDARGVKVYNATIGGELEVYPRVDLMEII
jgi:hypothetical protein